ncbi:glycosyltransferase [Prosthecobacter sp.]|uniref:glycosyltransferase n=1 Tax=Prosthecobacter sp. TaxID=1965333 RepID=UPI003783170B
MKPSCGVLMPCRGELAHVKAAIGSMLNQTHRDFDLLILDDEATPDVSEYLAGLRDARVRVVRHDKALGVSACLAKGLGMLTTDLVFRMDSDDIAHPERMRLQFEKMIRQPELGVLGAQIRLIGSQGRPPRVPLKHSEIGYRMNWSNALNHPTVVFRREVVVAAGGYDTSLECAQDYDLWMRLFFSTRIENMPETLLDYRVHASQNSSTRRSSSAATRARMRQKYREQLTGCHVDPSFDQQEAWTAETHPDAEGWDTWMRYLTGLQAAFRSGKHAEAFNPGRDLARRLWQSARRYEAVGGSPKNWRALMKQLNRWQALLKGVL